MNAHSSIFKPSNDTQVSHFIECLYSDGPMFCETPPGYSEAECVKDIIEGQAEGLTRIIAVNIEDGTARDVSEDIARLIAQINPERCSDAAINLCSKFGCLTWQMGA
jgi:hypothetical protein